MNSERGPRRALEAGRARRFGLIATVAGAVALAELAVWLLRPRKEIAPVDVPESSYFSAAQLDRARDFAGGQRLLALAAIAIQGAVLVALVARPPARALRLAEQMSRRRRLVAGALVGAGLAGALELAPLPLRAWAHDRAVDAGLSTQRWGAWLLDTVKGLAIVALLTAAIAALFLLLMRRFPRRWWLSGAAAVVAIEVLFVWLAPVVLAPIFNRFEPLAEGRTRSDVLALARKAGVDVGQVYVVDASRRTRGANAYVTGLGHTKRVVLYDTLIDRFTPAQVRLVVAHELGHVKREDLLRGMLWVALVAPIGMLLVARLTERWAGNEAVNSGSPRSLPALALALALVSFAGGVISNQLSRRIEARADAFALELTHQPRQFIDMERKLAVSNLGDPDPPEILHWLFGTHPTAIERIGAAVAFERESDSRAR